MSCDWEDSRRFGVALLCVADLSGLCNYGLKTWEISTHQHQHSSWGMVVFTFTLNTQAGMRDIDARIWDAQGREWSD